ncbi:MAG: hypothetical protein IJT76_03980, partial [Clostridia bacterium]|nr:hypothetical protein [Clostridia bacterium]
DAISLSLLRPAFCGGFFVLFFFPTCCLQIFFRSCPVWGLTFYLQAFFCRGTPRQAAAALLFVCVTGGYPAASA